MDRLVLFAALAAAEVAAPASLDVVLTGVRPGGGNVVVEVYGNQETFFKKPLASKVVAADGPRLEAVFELPDGEYAVSAYQDRNGNGVLDKNMFHIPTEPYGLSNHFRPKWSKPTFDDCKFALAGKVVSAILLK